MHIKGVASTNLHTEVRLAGVTTYIPVTSFKACSLPSLFQRKPASGHVPVIALGHRHPRGREVSEYRRQCGIVGIVFIYSPRAKDHFIQREDKIN